MHLRRRAIAQALVWTVAVVEMKVGEPARIGDMIRKNGKTMTATSQTIASCPSPCPHHLGFTTFAASLPPASYSSGHEGIRLSISSMRRIVSFNATTIFW